MPSVIPLCREFPMHMNITKRIDTSEGKRASLASALIARISPIGSW